ncbi:MAG: Rv1355c family protein [Actinomycetota bacterium]|nr:Rv1355c family protein [Actinomycetota bacterium]
MTFERSETPATDTTGPAGPHQGGAHALVLDPATPDGSRTVAALRADPAVTVVDTTAEQARTLAELLPPPGPELTGESWRWAYYPWRQTLVGILGPRAYRRVRTDRNRNLISDDEQRALSGLRVGVIGLSVGHAIAHTLAMQGLCGELRLADFDELELSNLNRVPATVFELGLNKAIAAARRIAEIDPYLPVRVESAGLTADTVDGFLDGLDIVVEECDSLDVKALVRESARARGLPVLMATSDRGLVDVERFDAEPDRPVFHGLLGGIDAAALAGLDNRDKIPHVLRLLEGQRLSPRAAASLVEVGQTLATWPQLAGDVLIGAAAVAEAVRRIALGERLPSGRVRVDMSATLDALTDPSAAPTAGHPPPAADEPAPGAPRDPVHAVALAASRAPSGGNSQPWHIDSGTGAVTIRLAPEFTSTMDVGFRGSAVAVGAAVFNARVAAAAHELAASVDITEDAADSPLTAIVELTEPGSDDRLAKLWPALTARETNRRPTAPAPLDRGAADALRAAAQAEGARLVLLDERDTLDEAGAILAEADRIRYLTTRLHREMVSELRWPGDESPDTGIDVRSLELSATEAVTLDILKQTEVMSLLASWEGGASLGTETRDRIARSSALAVIIGDDPSLAGYARGGSAAEAVWLTAQQHDLAVQPVSPVFLYARDDADLEELSAPFAAQLAGLRTRFRRVAGIGDDETEILALRLGRAPRASVRSRRRALDTTAPAVS